MMRRLVWVIESISEWSGKVACWACLALVMVLCYEVVARYAFFAPTIWAHATACMLGITLAAMGLAYTHRHDAHVRVDVLYMHLSPRAKVIIDIIGAFLFFIPVIIALIYRSWVDVLFAWTWHEVVTISYWYPPALPIRAVFFVGFSLFILQGVARLIRDFHFLIRNKAL